MIYIVMLAPFLATHDPINIDWSALTQGPSKAHWLGTDEFGRDLFSRTLYGSRVAMGVGVLAVMINSLIGTSTWTFSWLLWGVKLITSS